MAHADTENSAVLRTLYPQQLYVELHPSDARLGIKPAQRVKIRRAAAVTANAVISNSVKAGKFFISMH
jgi:assimilatory nitrate reductase catalytic subunit